MVVPELVRRGLVRARLAPGTRRMRFSEVDARRVAQMMTTTGPRLEEA
jgi:hypothetical protein